MTSSEGNTTVAAMAMEWDKEALLAAYVRGARTQGSLQLLGKSVVVGCFRPQLERLLNASLESLSSDDLQLSALPVDGNTAKVRGA
jgi:hypothetical protein